MATTLSGNGVLITQPTKPPTQCAAYKGLTKVFNIPVLSGIGTDGGPQTLSELCEQRAANIIDNNLRGAVEVHGGEGRFSLGTFTFDTDDNQILLDELRAFIGTTFVENLFEEFVVWDNIDFSSSSPYLFIGTVETADTGTSNFKSSLEFGDLVTRSSSSSTPNQNEILIGKVASGVPLSVNTSIVGVKTLTDIEDHIFADNPHGNMWFQDTATASGVSVSDTLDSLITFDTVSGLYNTVPAAPGLFEFETDMFFNSGVTVSGDFFAPNSIVSFRNVTHHNLVNIDGLIVESGLEVFNPSTAHDDWFLRDSTSGIGFVPISGLEWDTKTSDGLPLERYDPSFYGLELDKHLLAVNPHCLCASGINSPGILSIYGDTLVSGLDVESGVAIDGIDLSEMNKFIDGSVIDTTDHSHFLLRPIEYSYFIPAYPGAIVSGVQPGVFQELFDEGEDKSYYTWSSLIEESSVKIILKGKTPDGVRNLSGVDIFTRVGSGVVFAKNNVELSLFNDSNTLVSRATAFNPLAFDITTLSGITNITDQEEFKLEIELNSAFGLESSVSDVVFRWET
jgi:hypothetical protein